MITEQELLKSINWSAQHLVPAIAQDHITQEVLMLAWMNLDALKATLDTRQATYWSRSRQCLWIKGATSGHWQNIKDILLDCDGDTILLKVEQVGGISCHTGKPTCFYQQLRPILK
jgi:phosphoribosyl-AMP cyclohydrolase